MRTVDHVHDTAAESARSLCLRLQQEFSWEVCSSAYAVLDGWSSRTADFVMCKGDAAASAPVVVKLLTRERVPDPRGSFEMLQTLGELHRRTDALAARPPDALGWSEDPPGLVMSHVAGRDGGSFVRDRLVAADVDALARLGERCGATLGAWHRHWGMTWEHDPDHPSRHRLVRTAKRQGIALGSVLSPETPVRLVHRFRDFGIYNFRCSDDGDLAILDPPPASSRTVDVAGRDVAWFLASLASAAVSSSRAGGPRGNSLVRGYRRTRPAVVHGFAMGYEQGAGRALSGTDWRLAALIEAGYLAARARGRLRRTPRRAAWCARLGLEARRGAVRDGGAARSSTA